MAVAVTPPKNMLEFDSLVRSIRDTFKTFPDKRTGKNTQYRLEDAALSAFSVSLRPSLNTRKSWS